MDAALLSYYTFGTGRIKKVLISWSNDDILAIGKEISP